MATPQQKPTDPNQRPAAALTAEDGKKPRTKLRFVGRLDLPLLTLTLVLLMFGMVMLFSASYPTGIIRHGDGFAFVMPQLKFALVGLVVMVGAALVDYHILRRFAWPLMFVVAILLIVVLFMPEKNGAQRWIWLNGSQTSSIQPSELAKFAVILLFAALIAANQSRMNTFTYGIMPFLAILGVTAVLLIAEPHLSCTILVLGIGFAMLFAGGAPMKWCGLAVIAGVVGVYLIIEHPELVPYAGKRIEMWRDPFSSPDDDGHQIIQSLIAVGSGGFRGRGLGNSVQKFLYLPEMYNDYIFAVLCEELGFVGALLTMLLFLALLLRGLHVALRAKDKFGAMLAVGISVQIALQTFLHIAVNTNSIPSTGISMPFFSSGGSSLVMLMGQVGVMLSVSRQAYGTVAEARLHREEELEAAKKTEEQARMMRAAQRAMRAER